jgi:acetyltransferase-like isoleucine patch superfamily enzyme
VHGYILKTGARVLPFGDEVGETRILDERLEDYQRRVLSRFCSRVEVIEELDQIREKEHLLVEDHLFFTHHFVRRALRLARREPAGRALRLALGDCRFLHEKAPLGGLQIEQAEGGARAPLPMWLWRGAPLPVEKAGDLPLCVVPIRERAFVPRNLRLLRDDLSLTYSITREGVLSVRHWSHILDANQVALAAFWIDFSVGRVLWLAWRALTALTLDKHLLAQNINVIGRRCDIHPTAFVAGSVLGDGVTVGPNSVVFGSVLGDGAQVEGMSQVDLSVVGAGAVVSFHTKITASVLYPTSMASYPAMQMCVLGRRALHMGGAYPIDMKLTRGELLDVKVRHEGSVVPSGKKFLGICIGHRAIVGTGLWLQSGVEVPNDYILVRDRAQLVTRIPDGEEERVLSLQGGQLKPY